MPKTKKGYARKVDRKMRDYGEIDYDKKVIRVNPKKGDLINTILHEELHKQHPGWNEKKVKKEAAKKEKSMSLKTIAKKLLKYT